MCMFSVDSTVELPIINVGHSLLVSVSVCDSRPVNRKLTICTHNRHRRAEAKIKNLSSFCVCLYIFWLHAGHDAESRPHFIVDHVTASRNEIINLPPKLTLSHSLAAHIDSFMAVI